MRPDHTPQLPLFTAATNNPALEIPFGYCQCGCGQMTRIAKYSDRSHGLTRGMPLKFINGHNNRLPPLKERKCTKCKEVFPLTLEYFNRAASMSNGFSGECKKCGNARSRARHPAYYAANAERERENSRLYYAQNKERAAAYAKRRRESSRDRDNEQRRRYRLANKEKVSASNRQWRQAHRDYMRAHKHKRRALQAGSHDRHTAADIHRLYQEQDGKCRYCNCDLNGNFHVDHVIPLTRGGSDAAHNIAISCAFCNQSKGNKLLSEWLGYREP